MKPLTVVIALFLAACAGWGLARHQLPSGIDELDVAPVPVEGFLDLRDRLPATNSTLQISQEQPRSVPGDEVLVGGRVLAIYVEDRTDVLSGDPIVNVGGSDLFAMTAEAPLFRATTRGDTGSDVASVQRFLVDALDIELDVDGVFSTATRNAVRRFEADLLDVGRPTGVFRPEWVVWIGPTALQEATAPIRIGDRISEVEHVLRGPTAQISVSVELPDGLEASPGRYDFRASGESVSVQVTPEGLWSADGGSVSLFEFAELGELDSDPATPLVGTVPGLLVSEETEEVLAIPGSAVVVDPSEPERRCVAIRTANGWRPAPITIVGTSADGFALASELRLAGERVLLNPWQILEDVSCG